MKRTEVLRKETARPTSLFTVAFMSSAMTIALTCLLVFALNFGFVGGAVPVIAFFKNFGVLKTPTVQISEASNVTQVIKPDSFGLLIGKTSITTSVAFKSADPVEGEAQADLVIDSKDAEPEPETVEVGFEEPAVEIEHPTNLPEGIPAMLRRKSNGIEIGNFRSVTMDGAADECLNLGYTMLSAAKAKQDLLDVMVANNQITIANICASNGKVVFSCRNGKISISPRRARPDDSCSRA
jgi:hypothetical protein